MSWQFLTKYSGPCFKGHFLERTLVYKGYKFLAVSTANACGTPSHQKDTSLIRTEFYGRRDVLIRGLLYYCTVAIELEGGGVLL